MKKLALRQAGIQCATRQQAATFDWANDGDVKANRLYGVAAGGVTDNATGVAASTTLSDRLDKDTYSLQAMITLFTAGTDVEVGKSGWVNIDSGDKGAIVASGMDVAAATAGTTYDYRIDIKGTQGSLTSKGTKVDGGDGYDYDYSAAIIESSVSGSVTTELMGGTTIGAAAPTTWSVSGITKTAQSGGGGGSGDVPEPTSGLLLLVGGAMLALRRKQK